MRAVSCVLMSVLLLGAAGAATAQIRVQQGREKALVTTDGFGNIVVQGTDGNESGSFVVGTEGSVDFRGVDASGRNVAGIVDAWGLADIGASVDAVEYGPDGASRGALQVIRPRGGETVHIDCAPGESFEIIGGGIGVTARGPCGMLKLHGGGSEMTAESAQTIFVQGGGSEATVGQVGEIIVEGAYSHVYWRAGLGGRAPRVAVSGIDASAVRVR